MSAIPSALLSGLFSGVVAMSVSIAIEKFGGAVGGVLGSSPTTLIPASIGLWITLTRELDQNTIVDFQKSMLVVCIAMVMNALFLYCWRVLPGRLTRFTGDSNIRLLVALTLCSYLTWLIGATLVVVVVSLLTSSVPRLDTQSAIYIVQAPEQRAIVILAISFILLQLLFALRGCWSLQKTPKSTSQVSFWSNLLRGLAAGLSIFLAVLLGKINPFIGGITSMFPAIFGTAMISVWLTSGSAVSVGAVEPMILGSLSTSIFAFNVAFVLPAFYLMYPQVGTVVCAYLGCYLVSVFFVSFPCHKFLEWRAKQNNSSESQTIIVLEPVSEEVC